MAPRRRSSLASDGDDPESSETSTPPPADPLPSRKRAPASKKPRNSDVDSSLELSQRKAGSNRPKAAAKAKRKREEEDEVAEAPIKKGKAPVKAPAKRSKADAGKGRSNSSQEVSRQLPSSDSDMFEFTTEAYRAGPAQQTSFSQPLARPQPNGKSTSSGKASSQPLPPRTADLKGKKRADVTADTSATSKTKAKSAAAKEKAAMPPPPAPAPTTPRGKTKLNPVLHAGTDASRYDSTIEVGIADTPMQNKNIAMRKAADAVPSGSRRTSFERRGRRSSFVGDGFEALPHPSVEDGMLHRHINPNELPSVRFLTLVSWAAQRQVKRMAEEAASSSSLKSSKDVEELAQKVAEAFISNIAANKIDLQWSQAAEQAKASSSKAPMLKNEANEHNKEKRDALEAWTQAMNAEQIARSNVKPRYLALQAPRQPSASLIDVPTETVDFNAALPRLKSASDVFSYGRSLLEKAQADPQPVEKASEVDIEAELSFSFEELRLQSASLRQSTHRIDQLACLMQKFAHTRTAAIHRALGSTSLGGPAMPEASDLLRALTRAELPPPRR